ncbi:MAG: hypothetical protein JOZ54_17245 [Acidobacteria bacterium]|nr:hypothetical protein [Acidobacteriota bacterium]
MTERKRLSVWAPANGWEYLEFVDSVDLLARLSDRDFERIDEIELIAHGNTGECNDVGLGNALTFGENLRRLRGFTRNTRIYLSGCNTGLEFAGACVARELAQTSEARVLGALGYLAGTHAEGNETCVAAFTHAGIVYEALPGAVSASSAEVWQSFGPALRPVDGEDMDIKISTSGFRPIKMNSDQVAKLRTAIEEALQRPPAESAPFRVAPDLRFSIRLADGEHIFELLAGGTVLRDPIARRVWQLAGGRALLESLLPFRNGAVPAA